MQPLSDLDIFKSDPPPSVCISGTAEFEKWKEKTAQRFGSKPMELNKFNFACMQVEHSQEGYLTNHGCFCLTTRLRRNDCSFEQYRIGRVGVSVSPT